MEMTLLDDAMVQFSLLWAGALFVALISAWLRNSPVTPDGARTPPGALASAWQRTKEGERAA
jgi:hypothetical protein